MAGLGHSSVGHSALSGLWSLPTVQVGGERQASRPSLPRARLDLLDRVSRTFSVRDQLDFPTYEPMRGLWEPVPWGLERG